MDDEFDDDEPETEEMPPREIEVCSNCEWWRVMGPASDIEDDDDIREMIGDIHYAIAGLGHEPSRPHGQRILLHGWNGAHSWARHHRGVCTFSHFTADEWKAVEDAVDAVIDEHCAKALAEQAEA